MPYNQDIATNEWKTKTKNGNGNENDKNENNDISLEILLKKLESMV